MFARFAALAAVSTLVAFAAAAPGGGGAPTKTVTVTAPASTSTEPASQCNTGPVQCCNSVQSSSSLGVTTLLGLLGVVLEGVAVPVGLTCDPISVIGVGGNSCSANPVCCENNSFKGVVALGCVPVNLSL